MAPRTAPAPLAAGSFPDTPPPHAGRGPDPNRKTARSFQCRDALWSELEALSSDLECSVDYLINESVKHYLRLRAAPPVIPPSALGQPAVPPTLPPLPSGLLEDERPTVPPAESVASPPHTEPPEAVRGGALGPPAPDPHTAPPKAMRGTQVLPLAPGTAPTSSGEVREAAPAPRSLVAIFEGKRYPVTKDRFLIGRGKETSDLLINEPSASRRHALVERIGSQYFLVDLESVNGVEYEGRKLLRKQIAEGDVFSFCGCRVRFTYEKNP